MDESDRLDFKSSYFGEPIPPKRHNLQHRHKRTKDALIPFNGTASGTRREDQRAHGGCAYLETCACGAQRVINVNQRFREVGAWYDVEEEE